MAGVVYRLTFGNVRDQWTQGPIDRLLEQEPGALLASEWTFTEERVRQEEGYPPEYQLRAAAPDGRVFVWVPSQYTGGSWAGPFGGVLGPTDADYLRELLNRHEAWANDYAQGRDEHREWAARIDRVRAAAGLPLEFRHTPEHGVEQAMTLVLWLEGQWARIDGTRQESGL